MKAEKLVRALRIAAHSGFPWAGPGGALSRRLRRQIRRSVIIRWPAATRPAARVLMCLLWPVQSLRDAVSLTRFADPAALAGRARAGIAFRAWCASLLHNLPAVDFLAYRLFEEGRPGPADWLHSGDAHLHFAALAAPQVRDLVQDKLAFAEFAERCGAPVVPALALCGPAGMIRDFPGGAPPPRDLIVKPRLGHGGHGVRLWRWDGARHVAAGGVPDPATGPGFRDWLLSAAEASEMLVQELALPPDALGGLSPSEAPVLQVFSVEWPDRRRALACAQLMLTTRTGLVPVSQPLEVDVQSGRAAGPPPGIARPIWRNSPLAPAPIDFVIPDWPGIVEMIDRVHAALPGPAPVLKWDVLLTDAGPRLIEANVGPSVYMVQAATLRPITETPIGDALEAWAG